MGVPKFFRYISERYPCLSEIVRNFQIPDFDNLYLDMNGIIHTCSHPDDGDVHFRISEEQIFKDIFHYIEVLFRMIKPKKLFFMAIDGVAPRAKMNQQRGRRFNSAKAAEKLETEAKEKGEVLPPEARFDSNCITPGTEFMARLHEQLKYFIVHKISTDPLWAKCRVILSGHETPGEGEHKIMDYIRYTRSQPGYDPNTRHCLYGLDADLIMLGLCTHEPHFSLLREEVKFGRKSTKRKWVPEEITFFLLHLSLMRDYLEMEFAQLKENLPFKFDLENIIDDWVLMGFLVGNDFIPHLPNLHITKGALPILYNTYMKTLPTLEGYINEKGVLNLLRFEKFMETLASVDMDNFSEQFADIKYFEAKTGRRPNENERTVYKSDNPDDQNLITFDSPTNKVIEPSLNNLETLALDEDIDPELIAGQISPDMTSGSEDEDDLMYEEFRLHKKDYYMNKLEYEQVTPEVLRDQAEGYVKAIQWNLYYYYNGCASWSWYYPHHYAPYISDIKGFGDLKMKFDLGEPFKPYEQLLAVLPSQSKGLLPGCFQHLMTDDSSPIKPYYPLEFKKDLNGKKQDWEAVVLVPFIDEKVLLKAMEPYNKQLTPEEAERNTHRPMLVYTYSKNLQPRYKSPGYFPDVTFNHAECRLLSREDIRVPPEKLIKGAYPGAQLDVYYPGFPTFKHLRYTGKLEMAKVKVFEQSSRNESMIVQVAPVQPEQEIVNNLLGRVVYVEWPHLTEALVVAVSNEKYRYHYVNGPGQFDVEENKGNLKTMWQMEVKGISEQCFNRYGIDVGSTSTLIHVKVLAGRKLAFSHQGAIELEKQWAQFPSCFPLQTVVRDIVVHEELWPHLKTIADVFPVGGKCFMLGHPHYGSMGEVLDSKESLPRGRLKVSMKSAEEPVLFELRDLEKEVNMFYMPLFAATSQLSISKLVFSKITGTVYLISRYPNSDTSQQKVNVGLNLKFNVKNLETPGYTRKVDNNWLYSNKTVMIVRKYIEFCPKLFEYLSDSQSNDVIKEDLFPENTEQKVKDLKEFVKELPCSSVERQQTGSRMLDSEIVSKIESIVDKYQKSQILVKNAVLSVKPHLLYKEDVLFGDIAPDPQATYQLCDRIVNVKEGYSVPLGLKGTVVGIHKTDSNELYDVVFDQPFTGGFTLNCSPGRGYKLTKTSMINLSHGAKQYRQLTGMKGQLKNTLDAQRSQDNGYKSGSLYANMFPLQNSAFASLPRNHPPMIAQATTPVSSRSSERLVISREQSERGTEVAIEPERYDQSAQTGSNWRQERNNVALQPYVLAQRTQKVLYEESNVQKFLEQVHQKQENTAQGTNQTERPEKINTDVLKKLLNLNTDTSEKQVGTTMSAEDFFAKTKEKAYQAEDACKTLWGFYQSRQLGCPRYQYFNVPNGAFQAQIQLPSGQIVLGDPAASKDLASVNVAQRALKILAIFDTREMQTRQMPHPPDNWYRANQNPPEVSKLTSKMMPVPNNDKLPTQTPFEAKGSNKFVPLQAVRQQVTNKNTQKKNLEPKASRSDSSSVKVQPKNSRQEEVAKDKNSHQPEKRRERKMRIAANFKNS